MAEPVTYEVRRFVSDPAYIRVNAFSLLKQLSILVNRAGQQRDVHELVLRALENRDAFGPAKPILQDLVRKQGLYPYLEPEELDIRSLFAYETHRPYNFDEHIVFHEAQARIYRLLLEGENVILSAPTSFGKSLIIDAVVASGKYNNIVIVVPTIALIDETRRRLVTRFGGVYKIITHPTQRTSAKNIFVFTQERVIEASELPRIDFFVIDEFYKLDPKVDSERSILLNQAFYKLWQYGAQFYMLGPNIHAVPTAVESRFECRVISTDYATVVSEIKRVQCAEAEKLQKLVEICRTLDEPTLIYCSSPASVRKVVLALRGGGVGQREDIMSDAADWTAREYHNDWYFSSAIQMGIGVHHGRIPRSLAQFIVRSFNSEHLKFLVCTSTLIEGVNTKAKNVIIFDHKISTRTLDYFTFNNIKGRSGRMFQHFVGRVYLFRDPPTEEFPFVDFPLVSQSDDVPESLLVHLSDQDLSENSVARMSELRKQTVLPLEIIRENSGIDPASQVRLAEELSVNRNEHLSLLQWRGFPKYYELQKACILIWDHLVASNQRRAGVSSGRQLALKIWRFTQAKSVAGLIVQELEDTEDADDAVENALEFLRYWVTYNFPRYLMVLNRIQAYIYGSSAGDFSLFASQVEGQFLARGLATLDEYGVPVQAARKLSRLFPTSADLDTILELLPIANLDAVDLHPFEYDLVQDAQRYV